MRFSKKRIANLLINRQLFKHKEKNSSETQVFYNIYKLRRNNLVL